MIQKYLIFTLIYGLFFTSCNKTDLKISPTKSNKIIINGIISNHLETQKINLKYNSSITVSNNSYINDATIYINYQNCNISC